MFLFLGASKFQARSFSDPCKLAPVIYCPRLQEVDWGMYEGLLIAYWQLGIGSGIGIESVGVAAAEADDNPCNF